MSTKQSEPITASELRDLRAELREEREWRERLGEKVASLEKDLRWRCETIYYQAHRLLAERQELEARVYQINLNLCRLGYVKESRLTPKEEGEGR